jgi:hypothetical protein
VTVSFIGDRLTNEKDLDRLLFLQRYAPPTGLMHYFQRPQAVTAIETNLSQKNQKSSSSSGGGAGATGSAATVNGASSNSGHQIIRLLSRLHQSEERARNRQYWREFLLKVLINGGANGSGVNVGGGDAIASDDSDAEVATGNAHPANDFEPKNFQQLLDTHTLSYQKEKTSFENTLAEAALVATSTPANNKRETHSFLRQLIGPDSVQKCIANPHVAQLLSSLHATPIFFAKEDIVPEIDLRTSFVGPLADDDYGLGGNGNAMLQHENFLGGSENLLGGNAAHENLAFQGSTIAASEILQGGGASRPDYLNPASTRPDYINSASFIHRLQLRGFQSHEDFIQADEIFRENYEALLGETSGGILGGLGSGGGIGGGIEIVELENGSPSHSGSPEDGVINNNGAINNNGDIIQSIPVTPAFGSGGGGGSSSSSSSSNSGSSSSSSAAAAQTISISAPGMAPGIPTGGASQLNGAAHLNGAQPAHDRQTADQTSEHTPRHQKDRDTDLDSIRLQSSITGAASQHTPRTTRDADLESKVSMGGVSGGPSQHTPRLARDADLESAKMSKGKLEMNIVYIFMIGLDTLKDKHDYLIY